jgi:serine/threonine protein kinase
MGGNELQIPPLIRDAARIIGGRFHVVDELGRGGTGVVHRCVDLELGRFAAVKVFSLFEGDGAELDEARRRFVDEARLLASSRHPQIVEILDSGLTPEGAPYIATELLSGPVLSGRGPMGWRDVVEIGVQVAQALVALHGRGIIHRDIKPANIVAVGPAATGPLFIKVIDLGIAKVLDWARVNPELTTRFRARETRLGEIVGTPGYVAPEAGQGPADPQLDVFGLGVTLYQLCTGVSPGHGPMRPLRELVPKAPALLEELLSAMLSADLDERPKTAQIVLDRLLGVLGAASEAGTPAQGQRIFAQKFELIDVLGSGARSTVIRGYDRVAQREVAIKVLKDELRGDAEERRRFAVEAMLLGRLDDPAIPRIHGGTIDTASDDDPVFLVMSVAAGEPASRVGFGREPLGVSEVIEAGKQLARALVKIHEIGALHRDINPSNVLVERGPKLRASLIDLGMAELTPRFYAVDRRYMTPPERRMACPRDLQILKNLEWTAPEVRRGAPWSPLCDVFSLGFVLFRLATGKVPWRTGSTTVTSLEAWMPGCPEGLKEAFAGALALNPAQRLDAAGLLDALELAEEELREEQIVQMEKARAAEPATAGAEEPPTQEAELATAGAEDPPTREFVRPPPPLPAQRAPRWRRVVEGIASAAALIALGWWSRGLAAPPNVAPVSIAASAGASTTMVEEPPPIAAVMRRPEHDVAPPIAAVLTTPAPEPPTMLEALERSEAAFVGCAGLAEDPLVVRFVTVDGSESFASVSIVGAPTVAVEGCVAALASPIRFTPSVAQSLIKEYLP